MQPMRSQPPAWQYILYTCSSLDCLERWQSDHIYAITLTDSMSLLQKVKSGMESPGWHVSMFDIHLRRILWVYCPGHAGVKGNDWADRLAGKATITGGLIVSLKIWSAEELETLPACTELFIFYFSQIKWLCSYKYTKPKWLVIRFFFIPPPDL